MNGSVCALPRAKKSSKIPLSISFFLLFLGSGERVNIIKRDLIGCFNFSLLGLWKKVVDGMAARDEKSLGLNVLFISREKEEIIVICFLNIFLLSSLILLSQEPTPFLSLFSPSSSSLPPS